MGFFCNAAGSVAKYSLKVGGLVSETCSLGQVSAQILVKIVFFTTPQIDSAQRCIFECPDLTLPWTRTVSS